MTIGQAVDILYQHGLISTPDYWKLHAQQGQTVDGAYAAILIQNVASKINAGAVKFA